MVKVDQSGDDRPLAPQRDVARAYQCTNSQCGHYAEYREHQG